MLNIQGNKPGASNAHQVTIPCIVFFVVTPLFILVRLWSRLHKEMALGWDDWTILFSFACTLTVQILMMFSVEFGFGQHVFNLAPDNRMMALKLFYIAQIFYKVTINMTKTSILLLYLRIFVQKWFRISCWVLMGIILSYMVATTGSSIFQCNPISGAWDKSSNPTCISLTMNWYANAGFSIATDVIILLLPMQPLWTSKISMNSKVALMVVFALGGFVTVTSIMRATTLDFSTTTPDITYDIASTLWTMIEENIAIICACMPMCRMPLSYIFPALLGTTTGGKSSGYRYGSSHRSQTQNSEWAPYSGNRKGESVNLSVVQNNDAASEEYILGSMQNPDGQGTIVKTTQYQIHYDEINNKDKKSHIGEAQ